MTIISAPRRSIILAKLAFCVTSDPNQLFSVNVDLNSLLLNRDRSAVAHELLPGRDDDFGAGQSREDFRARVPFDAELNRGSSSGVVLQDVHKSSAVVVENRLRRNGDCVRVFCQTKRHRGEHTGF